MHKLPDHAVRYMADEFRLELAEPGLRGNSSGSSSGFTVIPVEHLIRDKAELRRTVTRMSAILQTGMEAAAASLFAKAYGRILVGALFGVSLHDTGPGLVPERTLLLLHPERGELRLVTDAADCEFLIAGEGRDSWRDRQLRRLFAEHLQPLLSKLAELYAVQPAALWENSLVYILHYYREWENSLANSMAERAAVREDLARITGTSAGTDGLTGCRTNPFAVEGRLIPHPVNVGQTLRIRKTCCLKSQTAGGRACTICPAIRDEARAPLFDKK